LIARQLSVHLGHETTKVVSSGRFEVVTVERFRLTANTWRQPQSAMQACRMKYINCDDNRSCY